MKRLKNLLAYFSLREKLIWLFSVSLITVTFFVFSNDGYLSFIASLIGATSLIFCAKGNFIGQILMIIFSTMYAVISYTYSYYGELMTYAFMTAPMAVVALISWIRNPSGNKRAEVRVNKIKVWEIPLVITLSALLTLIFYFVLKTLGTSNLLISTVSITTSFIAVYLTFRRSPYFALAYALNDVVLIVLWVLASISNISYVSVVACFSAFLVNDLYSFTNWRRMERRQRRELENKE
jgi:nicotinamide mononucleotide transporter PnuC